jgi:beta-lactamase superfamily II metal-dependent hydrolase
MSAPSAQSPVLATLRVRMYQVGFGDCFLLSFEYAGQAEPARHMLIDFGTRELAAGLDLADVASEIDAHTGGGPDVVVLSHRHQDHMSGFGGSGTEAIVGQWKPRLVVRPWTEDPEAPADAAGPGGTSLRAGLDQGRAFANALSQEIATSARGVRADLRDLAIAQLANQAALDRLNAWSQGGKGAYVNYGKPLDIDAVVPGVQVHVIGPPTVAQHPAVAKQRSTSPEYWQLYHSLVAAGAVSPAAEDKTAAEEQLVGPARWVVERLQGPQLRSLLRIVTALDHAMNNTSVILLIQAGDRRLLFCGDAQIENWEYALTVAGDSKQALDLLRGVDLYKVGHHGSRNATPRTLFNLWTEPGTRERKMTALMSTKPGVFPGKPGSGTEVPRQTLLTALRQRTTLCSTMDLPEGTSHIEVAAPAVGDAPFIVVDQP